jgi:hypothetical protein
MSDDKKRYWFPAKRYGWGWGSPVKWQGKAVVAVWFAVFAPTTLWLAVYSLPLFCLFITIMPVTLIAICYLKGEPPRWR